MNHSISRYLEQLAASLSESAEGKAGAVRAAASALEVVVKTAGSGTYKDQMESGKVKLSQFVTLLQHRLEMLSQSVLAGDKSVPERLADAGFKSLDLMPYAAARWIDSQSPEAVYALAKQAIVAWAKKNDVSTPKE